MLKPRLRPLREAQLQAPAPHEEGHAAERHPQGALNSHHQARRMTPITWAAGTQGGLARPSVASLPFPVCILGGL